MKFRYLNGYPDNILCQVDKLISEKKLELYLKNRYPKLHQINTDKKLYKYTMDIKKSF